MPQFPNLPWHFVPCTFSPTPIIKAGGPPFVRRPRQLIPYVHTYLYARMLSPPEHTVRSWSSVTLPARVAYFKHSARFRVTNLIPYEAKVTDTSLSWSRWPRRLRRRSAAARLLRLWVRISPGAWMSVCCDCCVLSGRSLCDKLITRPGVLQTVVRRCVWFRNPVNENALAYWEVVAPKSNKQTIPHITHSLDIFNNSYQPIYRIWFIFFSRKFTFPRQEHWWKLILGNCPTWCTNYF